MMTNPLPSAAGIAVSPRRGSARLLALSVALIFVGCLGAYFVKTDFGRVDISGFTLPTQGGQWVAADLFRPIAATDKDPVPLVVLCPGFERSKETLDSYAIELARRGMAVITIDPYAQGASSASRQRRSASLEGYGVVPMVEYVASTPNLNYVDKTRIGAAGYSAGGNAVLQAASLFGGGGRVRGAKKAAAKDTTAGVATTAATGATDTPKAKKKKASAATVGASAASDSAAKKPKKPKKQKASKEGSKAAKTGESAKAVDSSEAPKPKPPSKLAAVVTLDR
jgi:dienelactone hydrolase